MNRYVSRVLRVALMAGAAVSLNAHATAISVDGGWYGFCFDGTGSAASAGCQNEGVGVAGNSITFSSAVSVTFRVTDAFNAGDTFQVVIDGTPFFTSGVPTIVASITDPDAAFADSTYSRGSWTLAAGAHSVDVFADASPYGGGGAYLSAVSAVPEPTTAVLLGLGLVALTVKSRRGTSARTPAV
ncbi:MAG: PEP-CTERM sorting domain-containing protein [Burkholderiales bacterium]